MRVGVDATPLLGRRTGVGTYTAHLLTALAASGTAELVLTAFTARGAGGLDTLAPAGTRTRSRPVPARLLRAAWQRGPLPPVEWLCGRVDVFHATNFVLPPRRRAAGVVTVHDLSYLHHADTVTADSLAYRDLVPRALDRGAVVCTPSAAVAAEVVAEYGIAAERVVPTPLGVEPDWFDATPPDAVTRARIGLPAGPYLLAVGTLEPRKNLARLVAAHAAVWADGLQVPLVVAGPPGWGAALDVGAPGRVVLTGFLEAADLRAVVAGAAGLVFPSRYEGFGLPPLEALAAGTPVVASDLPVTREVLSTHAAFVPVDDDDALAAALRQVVETPPDAAARAAGRTWAARWTWAGCAEATRRAYALAAAGHRR